MKKHFFVKIICILLLFFSCFNMSYNYLSHEQNDLYSESLILTNLTHDRTYRFEDSGFIEYTFKTNSDLYLNNEFSYNNLYCDYYQNKPLDYSDYTIYYSGNTLNATFYSFFSRATGMEGNMLIVILRVLNALLMTALLWGIFVVLSEDFDIIGKILFFISILAFSPGITSFGANLFWSAWSFLLPFSCILFYGYTLKWKNPTGKDLLLLGIVSLLGILPRFLFSFEYTSTIIISQIAAYLYWHQKHSNNWKELVTPIVSIGIGSITSFLSCLAVWAIRVHRLLGPAANETIKGTLTKHITGDQSLSLWSNLAGISVSKGSVISLYLKIPVFYLFETPISLQAIILLTVIIFLLIYIYRKDEFNTLFPYIIAIIASLIGIASWIILATHHAYIHTHINYITFFIPMMFFVYSGIIKSLSILLKGNVRKTILKS